MKHSSFFFFFILYVSGPAGNTKTHILKCHYDKPRISAVIFTRYFWISYLLRFAWGNRHSHLRIWVISMFICAPGGVKSFGASPLLRQETLSWSVLNHFCDRVSMVFMAPAQRGVCRILFIRVDFDEIIRWSEAFIVLIWSRRGWKHQKQSKIMKWEFLGAYRRQQVNLSKFKRDHGDKEINK